MNIVALNDIVQKSIENEMILKQIIKFLPGIAHFKSATLKYKILNEKALKLFGVEKESDIVGLTDYDLAQGIMCARWNKDFVDRLHKIDNAILCEKKPLIQHEQLPYLDSHGKIIKYSITKIPIMNYNKQPIGILTFTSESNSLNNIEALRALYIENYGNTLATHKKFLKHLGLNKYLDKKKDNFLTQREFDVLAIAAKSKTAKQGAIDLGISPRTFEKHLDSLKLKLNIKTKAELSSFYNTLHQQLAL